MTINNSHDGESARAGATPTPVSDRVDPLEKVLRRIRRTKDFPTISKYVIEINQKLSEHSIQSSASELANIILKDYALTNKLLKLVNSAFYGFVAGKVTTVTRAVVLLGYDNVRIAAVSLVLFEHFKSNPGIEDLKDATVSSFWCGLLAREIARIQNQVDPEEAFICGLLHQLGKLLAIYHMPDQFQEIKHLMTRQDAREKKVVQKVLGISYQDLGIAVAKQWNFPERIFRSMTCLSVDQLQSKSKRVDPLCALSNFSNQLRRIVNEVSSERRDAALEKLLQRYGRYVTISLEQLKTVMSVCLESLYKHADALQFSLDACDFLTRLTGDFPTVQLDERPLKPIRQGGSRESDQKAFRLAAFEDMNTSNAALESEDAVSIIMNGIQEIGSVMMGDHDINDVALLSLEIIFRALKCNRTLLFINESREKMMAVRFGFGAGIQGMIGKIRFDISRPAEEDLFARSIQSGRDLIVKDTGAPELQSLIPAWYRDKIDAKAFIFLPITYQNICVGAYYADLETVGSPIGELDHKYLSLLRNQLVLAIKMGR